MSALKLSERQQSTVAIALTLVSALVIVIITCGFFILIGKFLSRFSGVILPLAVAGMVTLIVQPYYQWIKKKCNGRKLVAILLLYLSLLVPLAGLVSFFGSLLVQQLADLLAQLPNWFKSIGQLISERLPQLEALWTKHSLGAQLMALVQDKGDALTEGLQVVGQQVFTAGVSIFDSLVGFLNWIVFPVYLTFFLMANKPFKIDQVEDFLPFLKPETRRDVIYLAREFVNIIVAFFRGQLLIALLQGLLFAIGFAVIGLRCKFLLGLILGFLNIVPYLGSMLGLAIALPLAYFQPEGGFLTVALVMAVFVSVQMIEGYVLTPKIMGDRTGLHPVVIMVAIFFWGSALEGILGMVLAIPLTAFLVIFWRLAKEKYIKEVV